MNGDFLCRPTPPRPHGSHSHRRRPGTTCEKRPNCQPCQSHLSQRPLPRQRSCSSRSHEDPPNPRAARYRRKLPVNPPVVGVPQTPTAAASKPRVPADAVPSQSDTPPHLVLDARRSLITYISQVQLDHDAHRATRLTPRLYSPANRTARTTATRVRQHRTAAAAAADEQRQIPSPYAKSGTHPRNQQRG